VIRGFAAFGIHGVLALVVLLPLALLLTAALVVVWPLLFAYDSLLEWVVSRVFDVVGIVFGALVVWLITVVVAVITGLPIRLVPPVRRWWIRHAYVAFIGLVTGGALLVFAWAFSTVEQYQGYPQWVPNPWLLLVGWALFSFNLLHLWWPAGWRPRINRGSSAATGTVRTERP
jgi:hypothetical protein